jgi:hypothetical protein
MKFLFGMALPFIFFLLLMMFLRRNEITSTSYDERQNAIRGTAYKYATITGALSGFFMAFVVDGDFLPIDGGFALAGVSLLTITVYEVYMIMKGAYFGISGKWKGYTALIFIIGLSNLIIGIVNIIQYGLTGGRLTVVNIGLMLGIFCLIIVFAVFIQRAGSRKAEKE